MKLVKPIYYNILYAETQIVIPCQKGQETEIMALVDSFNRDITKDFEISVKVRKSKRSLDQNSLYQLLAHRVAQVMDVPFAVYHNRNLAEMGVLKLVEGEPMRLLLPDDDKYLYVLQGTHLCPTSKAVVSNGEPFRWFYLVKGSSEYSTKEMAALIEKVIEDCRSLDIEYESSLRRYENG